MTSIFERPLFINPQAYIVIPELLLMFKKQPIKLGLSKYTFCVLTQGRIEGKLRPYGEDYIMHLDLYESLGNCVLGEFIIDGSLITDPKDFNIINGNGIVIIDLGNRKPDEGNPIKLEDDTNIILENNLYALLLE